MTFNLPNPFNLDPQVTLDNAVRAVEALIVEIISSSCVPPKLPLTRWPPRSDLSWSDRLFLRSMEK